MEITATVKYLRVSPRKMQLLAKSVKEMPATEAAVTLGHINKSGAKTLQKLISSALANAKNKAIATAGELFIKEIQVLPGTAMKRFRAVSRGMAHSYKKRMSHVHVILTDQKKLDKKS